MSPYALALTGADMSNALVHSGFVTNSQPTAEAEYALAL
jgi:hypothetical protein